VVSLFKGGASLRERSHPGEIIGLLSIRIVHEAQECGRARDETVADTKTVGGLEKSTLEATVVAKRSVKARAPKRIAQVSIDDSCHNR
jgi:hypothetical protein